MYIVYVYIHYICKYTYIIYIYIYHEAKNNICMYIYIYIYLLDYRDQSGMPWVSGCDIRVPFESCAIHWGLGDHDREDVFELSGLLRLGLTNTMFVVFTGTDCTYMFCSLAREPGCARNMQHSRQNFQSEAWRVQCFTGS